MTGRIKRDREYGKIAIIGKIKIGDKSESGYPRSLDHFIAKGDYAKMFHDAFGAEPKKIEIIFVSDILEEVCNERYELRDNAGKLYAFGDGVDFMVYDSVSDKMVKRQPETPTVFMQQCAEKLNTPKYTAKWMPTLTLTFIIPRIKGVFGAWQFITKAEASTIPTIVGTFDSVMERAGRISNIPFDLIVDKVKSQKPNSKNAFPVVKLIPNISEENLERIAELMSNNPAALTGKITEDRIQKAIDYKNNGAIITEKER